MSDEHTIEPTRYRANWDIGRMDYEPEGDWVSHESHAAIVRAYEATRVQKADQLRIEKDRRARAGRRHRLVCKQIQHIERGRKKLRAYAAARGWAPDNDVRLPTDPPQTEPPQTIEDWLIADVHREVTDAEARGVSHVVNAQKHERELATREHELATREHEVKVKEFELRIRKRVCEQMMRNERINAAVIAAKALACTTQLVPSRITDDTPDGVLAWVGDEWLPIRRGVTGNWMDSGGGGYLDPQPEWCMSMPAPPPGEESENE